MTVIFHYTMQIRLIVKKDNSINYKWKICSLNNQQLSQLILLNPNNFMLIKFNQWVILHWLQKIIETILFGKKTKKNLIILLIKSKIVFVIYERLLKIY